MNKAEQFVYHLCKKSFLSLWSYANPKGKKGKELCDILVVCEPNIIIISVKEILITNSGDYETDVKRWLKNAVEKSINQIFGAERWLETATHVIRSDGSEGIKLPPQNERKIYRISVSLGSDGRIPIQSGDFDKGYIHVFDEVSSAIIFQNLDTIADFVEYLDAKENTNSNIVLDGGGEEDLLGYYLLNQRKLDQSAEILIITNDVWSGFFSSEDYKAKKQEDIESYIWDNFIELFCQEHFEGQLEFASELKNVELSLRTMAREDRFSRRILGKYLFPLLKQKKIRARKLMSAKQNHVAYVFVIAFDQTREYVIAELAGRCHVVRGTNSDVKTVIGIAIHQSDHRSGFALDLFYYEKLEWTDEDTKELKYIQDNFGFFVDAIQSNISEDEYPKKSI